MKYANIIHNGLSVKDGKRIINLGDSFEILAIDQLYQKMGIDLNDVVYIDFYNLSNYDGDYVILPINFQIELELFQIDMLKFSPKIIPVFLGLSLPNIELKNHHIEFLRKYQPIGCRDERTMIALRECGCDAYIGGCIVATLEPPDKFVKKEKKVFFINAPQGIESAVPRKIKERSVFVEHEFYVDYEKVYYDESAKNMAKDRILQYAEEAEMIVTSRFHGALIALALNIPFILVGENNFYKFSWLSKVTHFYENTEFHKIDWSPQTVDFTIQKNLMRDIAISRIRRTYEKYKDMFSLSLLLENCMRKDGKNLLYYGDACKYIEENWNQMEEIRYGIWGVSENAEKIYSYIQQHYKNAKLTVVYDGLQTLDFHGKTSIVPDESNCKNNIFTFVTSNTASKPAEELFNRIGKTDYFICKLQFLKTF